MFHPNQDSHACLLAMMWHTITKHGAENRNATKTLGMTCLDQWDGFTSHRLNGLCGLYVATCVTM